MPLADSPFWESWALTLSSSFCKATGTMSSSRPHSCLPSAVRAPGGIVEPVGLERHGLCTEARPSNNGEKPALAPCLLKQQLRGRNDIRYKTQHREEEERGREVKQGLCGQPCSTGSIASLARAGPDPLRASAALSGDTSGRGQGPGHHSSLRPGVPPASQSTSLPRSQPALCSTIVQPQD